MPNPCTASAGAHLSGIYAALHIEGVDRVELTSPTADVVVGETQASWCTAINVTHGGIVG